MSQSITVKVQYQSDIRRITVDSKLNWETLQNTLRSIFKTIPETQWNDLSIKYQDDENDFCTISSTQELNEAIALAQNSSRHSFLRLVLSHKTPEQQPQQTQPQPQQPLPLTEIPGILLGLFGEAVDSSAPHISHLLTTLLQATQQTQQAQTSEPEPVPVAEPRRPLYPRHQHSDRMRSEELSNEALVLMDAKQYSAAKEKLMEQLSLVNRPWHRSVPLYNIACCEALLGNLDSALESLERAVASGFRDSEHMKKDADLENLRNLEKFQQIVEKAAANTARNFWNRRCGYSNLPFVNRSGSLSDLQDQALALMARGSVSELKQAKELLSRQIEMCPAPWHKRIPLYNIACCHALLGDSESALRFLKESVDFGYKNIRHIEQDSDLDSLRHLEAYKEIVASIKSGHRCRGGWGRCQQQQEQQQQEQQQQVEQEKEEVAKAQSETAQIESDSESYSTEATEDSDDSEDSEISTEQTEEDSESSTSSSESSDEIPELVPFTGIHQRCVPAYSRISENSEELPELESAAPLSESGIFGCFQEQMQVLFDMGFVNAEQNLNVLIATKGNVEETLEILLR